MEMDTDDVKNEVSIDSLDETSESLNCNINKREHSIKVIKHPESQLKYYGKAVTLTVSVSGVGRLCYQWKKDGVNIVDDSNSNLALNFKGAKSPNLFIQSYTPDYHGSYTCTIRNEFDEVETNSAELGGLPTVITCHPPENVEKKYGNHVSLTVCAKGSSHLSYQWKKDGKLLPSDRPTPFSGADSPTLFIQSYTPNHAGNYECVISSQIDHVKSPAIKLRGDFLPLYLYSVQTSE